MKSAIFFLCLATTSLLGFAEDRGAAAGKAYKASMQKMQSSMDSMMMMNDPDMDFVMMMIPHHQAAIDMAKTELKYGHDPKLRKMATEIIKAQQQEIATMKEWQKAHPHHH